jgi:hypothetical protein
VAPVVEHVDSEDLEKEEVNVIDHEKEMNEFEAPVVVEKTEEEKKRDAEREEVEKWQEFLDGALYFMDIGQRKKRETETQVKTRGQRPASNEGNYYF